MKILITGAGGMVGSHMIEELYHSGNDVLGTYYKPTINLRELNPSIPLKECDVRYPQTFERIMEKFWPDQIYHLAAQSYPTVSWERPYETIESNICGTISIFESVKKLRSIRTEYDPVVVVACSSAEYGQTFQELNEPMVKETAQLKPLHPYGVSKVGQDLLSYQYYMNDNIKTIRARIFNTTGIRKVNDVTSDFTKRAVEQELLKNNPPILHIGNLKTQRAILDVKDLIRALVLLANKGTYGEAYNISSNKVYEISKIIQIIESIMNTKFKLVVDKNLLRTTDEPIIIGDIAKIMKDTGWKPVIPLEYTIESMIHYWRNQS